MAATRNVPLPHTHHQSDDQPQNSIVSAIMSSSTIIVLLCCSKLSVRTDGRTWRRRWALLATMRTRLERCKQFKQFYYICPTNAQYTLTISLSYSTATCFDVYASSSGTLLLCTLNLENLINFHKMHGADIKIMTPNEGHFGARLWRRTVKH